MNFLIKLKIKKRIIKFLEKYKINKYELIEDQEYGYVVNVNGDVNLNNDEKLESIDIKFNEINGNFNCDNNNLLTLKGCPEIVNGSFTCNNNKLTALKYAPKIIKKTFYCSRNELESLEGCPNIIEGYFDCSFNELKSLKGGPEIVKGNYYCNNNKITELKEGPKIVNQAFICNDNELNINELKYLPKKIEVINLMKNENLYELQNINNVKILKENLDNFFKIKEEKENILNNIDKKVSNKIIHKI